MNENYVNVLSGNILKLRKENGLTQEALADKLCISFQAVSKWENGQSLPDILLLPTLADIFNIGIDELFGRSIKSNNSGMCSLPWDNDDTIHGAVFKGHKLITNTNKLSEFTFTVDGDALNVEAGCNVNCGDVNGTINAGLSVNCDAVHGYVNAGTNVNCDTVDNNVNAGTSVQCDNVNGGVHAGTDVKCDNINGGAYAGCNIECDSIQGDAQAGLNIIYR